MSVRSIALVPGFMLDDALWDDFVFCLPDDWRVQRITLPRGSTVLEVAHGVAAQLDGPPMILGFSMGGYVACALAGAHPSLVDALVLIATSSRLEGAVGAKNWPQEAQAGFKGLSRRAIQRSLGPANIANEELVDRVHAMSLRLGGEAFAWQSALDRSDVPLQEISCPTLVVAAENDQLRTLQESQELAESIVGAELRVVAGAGHLIPLETPRRLAELISEWISTTSV